MQPCIFSGGRRHEETEDTLIMNPFLNDLDKIIKSKGFRREFNKAQVYFSPDNPHIRTRGIHAFDVIGGAVSIADPLDLSIMLCMAGAALHDIGHTPYGHLGERVLSKLSGKPFIHAVNSVVIAQHVERKGEGLNLTYATLEAALYHSRGKGELKIDSSKPQEYSAIMFADKIGYTFADLNDAIRFGCLSQDSLPECALRLGKTERERTRKTINALVEESKRKGYVDFSEGEVFENFDNLKKFMYENVYKATNEKIQVATLECLYEFFDRYLRKEGYSGIEPALAVSLLTDKEADHFREVAKRGPTMEDIKHFGVFEILPCLRDKVIDHTNPDLGWGTVPGNGAQDIFERVKNK